MAFLTRTEYLNDYPSGLPTDRLPSDHVDGLLERASRLTAGIVKGWHPGYHVIGGDDPQFPAELHAYDPDSLDFWLRHRPVRQVQAIKVIDAVIAGAEIGVELDGTSILMDQDMGDGTPFSLRLQFIGFDVSRFLWNAYQPQWKISYSAGWDGGYVLDGDGNPTSVPSATDGLVLPYPDWLQEACAAVADVLVTRYILRQRGMVGLNRLVTGPFTYQIDPSALPPDNIPPEAKTLVTSHVQQVWIASTMPPDLDRSWA